ncbi:MAG: hypothetical protein H0X13_09455 [Ramlibacter sp.]|nr:hypothetical protein [Ramlibacter sp.]
MAHIPSPAPFHVIGEFDLSDLENTRTLSRFGHRPSSGRTTALGRRVERPGTREQSGPSGQGYKPRHEGNHANK